MTKIDKKRSTHREVEVLDALRQLGGSARNANLADLLSVSEETIRRTTKALARADLVRRVHGGAYLPDAEATKGVFSRLGHRAGAKSRIARTAAAMIPDGSCIFLDVGSTTAFVAQELRKHRNLTVVTNSLNAAQALTNHESNRVFLAGGELHNAEWGAFGPDTLKFIRGFRFDTAVLSVDGVDMRSGFLLVGPQEAAVARVAVEQSDRVIVVADHHKFSQKAPLVVCPPQSVDYVVTDKPLTPAFVQKFSEWDVQALEPERANAQ